MLITGLNPYGLTYWLGLQGHGTPRANPEPRGLPGFLAIAGELGARSIELHAPWFSTFTDEQFSELRAQLEAAKLRVTISLGPPLENVALALRAAERLGAGLIRLGLTPVLCGDRAAQGANWHSMVDHARQTLRTYAPAAAASGIELAIENHQDLGSRELVDLAGEAGSNVGIVLDTGNPLAIGEGILEFTQTVAPLVRHVHLKDYRVQWTQQGFRLVRCAIGDGCVPFDRIAELLGAHHAELTASLEPGALESRHVRLFLPEWWTSYPPRTAAELGPCLADARRGLLPDDADCRTPWERESPPAELIEYELDMIRRSASNMRARGWM